mmetsp:Transcript_11704/g.29579  ORF Transcript_11704/g.29579 Transcript_11704/m.29579 type:complete len:257 (+) Transcript_11704:1328-2098(+)
MPPLQSRHSPHPKSPSDEESGCHERPVYNGPDDTVRQCEARRPASSQSAPPLDSENSGSDQSRPHGLYLDIQSICSQKEDCLRPSDASQMDHAVVEQASIWNHRPSLCFAERTKRWAHRETLPKRHWKPCYTLCDPPRDPSSRQALALCFCYETTRRHDVARRVGSACAVCAWFVWSRLSPPEDRQCVRHCMLYAPTTARESDLQGRERPASWDRVVSFRAQYTPWSVDRVQSCSPPLDRPDAPQIDILHNDIQSA